MNRVPPPEHPRRPVPRYGEGVSLIEPAEGLGADFIRGGGEHCPLCGAVVEHDDVTIQGNTVTAVVRCVCGFRAELVFRLIDAET